MKAFKQYINNCNGTNFVLPMNCRFSELMRSNGFTGGTLLICNKTQYLITLEKEAALNITYWKFTNTSKMKVNRI